MSNITVMNAMLRVLNRLTTSKKISVQQITKILIMIIQVLIIHFLSIKLMRIIWKKISYAADVYQKTVRKVLNYVKKSQVWGA